MKSGVLLAVASLLAALFAATGRAGTAILVAGHGWGHGVGLSQWGAYGYARHGWDYRRILRHYYPGTSFGRSGEPQVRVLLASGRRLAVVGCSGGMKVTDGHRYTRRLRPGRYGVDPRLVLPVRKHGRSRSLGRFAVFLCARAPLTLDGAPYHGDLVLRSNGRTLSVVNALPLDEYVRGVVPSESPSHWPLAELEAQAVAARSYAVSELKPNSTYDLLPDTRDQVYGGVAAERWKSDKAVQKTAGQILMWDGRVARTYYSSSSGGRTEAVQDAWPGAAPVPYLRSVPDPYDTYSPHHSWGPFEVSPGRLGVSGPVESVRIERNASRRVASVELRLGSGAVVRRSGTAVAQALGLRSTWFSFGLLRLSASRTRVVYGRRIHVHARAVGEKHAILQQRTADGWWRTVQRVRPGGAKLTMPALASTAFRLLVPGTKGTSVDIAVAPRLRVQPAGRRLLTGKVLPRAHGPVEVWRRERGEWRVVARPRIRPNGAFRTPLRLRPTVYRITVGADARLASAQTTFTVTRRLLASFRG